MVPLGIVSPGVAVTVGSRSILVGRYPALMFRSWCFAAWPGPCIDQDRISGHPLWTAARLFIPCSLVVSVHRFPVFVLRVLPSTPTDLVSLLYHDRSYQVLLALARVTQVIFVLPGTSSRCIPPPLRSCSLGRSIPRRWHLRTGSTEDTGGLTAYDMTAELVS